MSVAFVDGSPILRRHGAEARLAARTHGRRETTDRKDTVSRGCDAATKRCVRTCVSNSAGGTDAVGASGYRRADELWNDR